MKLQPVHVRLIANWFTAATQGKELVIPLPNDEDTRELMLARMREIAICNPSLFRNHGKQ